MQKQFDMAHVLGLTAITLAALAVFGLSVTFSYSFFATIAPPDKPWFPFLGLGLTEGGFFLWMIGFLLTRHHPIHKTVALLMVLACALCSLVIAGWEFYSLLADHYHLASDKGALQGISLLLVIIFVSHVVAFIIDLFVWYFAQPGHEFRNRILIPMSDFNSGFDRNLIPKDTSREHLTALRDEITGYLESGETDVPLEEEGMTFNQVGTVLKGGASTVMQKVKSSMRRGKRAGRVPGRTSTSTAENTSTGDEDNGTTFPNWQ